SVRTKRIKLFICVQIIQNLEQSRVSTLVMTLKKCSQHMVQITIKIQKWEETIQSIMLIVIWSYIYSFSIKMNALFKSLLLTCKYKGVFMLDEFKRVAAKTNDVFVFEIEKEMTLLPFLLKALSQRSRNSIKSILARGQVTVDEYIVTQFNYVLYPGQTVRSEERRVGKESRGRMMT